MKKVITEDDLESYNVLINTSTDILIKPATELLPVKQKINSIQQKEDAMHKLGLTRVKYMRVILDALDAYKWADVVDKQGNVKQEYVPDIEKQRWGAEQAAKLFGDYVQHLDANVKVTHSVEELLKVYNAAKKKIIDI